VRKERRPRQQRKVSRAREAELEARGSEARTLGRPASLAPFKENSPELEAWLRGWWAAELATRS